MSKEKTAEDLIAVFDKIGPGGTLPAEAAMMAIQSQLKAIDQELARLNGCKTTFDRHSIKFVNKKGRLKRSASITRLVDESWAYIKKETAQDAIPYPCIKIKNTYSYAKTNFILRKCGGTCRFHNVVGLIAEGPPEADKVHERVKIRIEELLARRKKLDKILSVCIERLADDYE